MTKALGRLVAGASMLLMLAVIARGEVRVVVDHNDNADATAAFRFESVPAASRNDAATSAKLTIVAGSKDPNSGAVAQLNDGKMPAAEDEPFGNFFFNAGNDGGRLSVDLGSVIDIKQINTYSWHLGDRGPQVYTLYGSEGSGADFNAQPKKGTDPERCGWRRIARVDTRPPAGERGGQYGVSISDPGGSLGRHRYLLFEISLTEDADHFGNTFYSEIDVIDCAGPAPQAVEPAVQPIRKTVKAGTGKYQIILDTTGAPDLTKWVHEELAPVMQEWYPKIVALLPSKGYEAPRKVILAFNKNLPFLAMTSGARVTCSPVWFRKNLQGEAKGAVVHELAHVVQQYRVAQRANPKATANPGWLVEGIADYVRWFKYEPQPHGTEITKGNLGGARYDASYRITANFLNWVAGRHGETVIVKLNAALREGRYRDDLWKQWTGHTVQKLGGEWKQDLARKLQETTPPADRAK